jgi:outer membrane protein insertion porin family
MAAASLQVGQIRQQYDLSYSLPWFLDKPQTLGFQLFKSHYDDTPVSTQRSIQERRGAVLSYGRNLRLFQSWSLSYRLADIRAMDVDADGVARSYSYSSSSLRPMWIHDSRDSRLEPTRGLRALLSLEYAGGLLGGTNSFWRPEAAFSFYRPVAFMPLSSVFGFNLQAGWIEPFGGGDLPPAERYFIGGPTSIRGFRTNSISLRDEEGNLVRQDGFLLGGTSFLELNLEYHLLLGGPFRLVFFADAGNVFGENQSFNLGRFRASAGAEVRVFVPMFGVPLRFGYAWNLNPLPEDQFESFQFSIGTSF